MNVSLIMRLKEFLFLPPWKLEPFRLDYPIQRSYVSVNHDSEDVKEDWKDWKVGRDGAEAIRALE